MKILSLDTSTLVATCSVICGNKVVGEYSLSQNMSHSENLMPMIEEIFSNLDFDIKDIDLYAVAIGPGSFTGLRIGVATIKAFAHLFNKPIIGVSTLDGLAYNLAYNDIIIPMIDARRDRVYTGIYTWESEKLVKILEPTILEIEELVTIADTYDNIIVNGDGSCVYKEIIDRKLKNKVRYAKIGQNNCNATSIGELAKNMYNDGIRHNYFTLAPEYLRQTQAQRELNKNKF